jgi:glycerophosphoryl diester phosphodiesterase
MFWLPVSGVLLALFGLAAAQQAPLFVIAHRGASGYRPEHTMEAYRLAIEMGADAIEPDLVITRDGVLIARHENEIGGTTDVAARFPDRRTTKVIDGQPVSGWFAEDFTLAEIRSLRARERLSFRSHAHDGRFLVPTFDEVLALAAAASRETGRTIAVYPETKHPSYFRGIGLPLEDVLLDRLRAHGLVERASPVFIQSFEPSSLEYLRSRTRVRLVQLTESPADVTPDRLAATARYADGIGPNKTLLVPVGADRRTLAPTRVVRDAHDAGLFVHAWTMRSEPVYLSPSYQGDPLAEVREYIALGVDGVFADFPDVAVRARTRP